MTAERRCLANVAEGNIGCEARLGSAQAAGPWALCFHHRRRGVPIPGIIAAIAYPRRAFGIAIHGVDPAGIVCTIAGAGALEALEAHARAPAAVALSKQPPSGRLW